MLKILSLIPSPPGKIDAARLASSIRRLGHEASLRSVQRDLIELSSVFPLRSDGNNPAGWSWIEKPASRSDREALLRASALTLAPSHHKE